MADPRRFDWLFRPQERDEDLPLSAEARFAEALAQLPAEERSALALSEIGGLDAEEIAERLGTERELAEDMVARARRSIRAALGGSRRLMSVLAPLQNGWSQSVLGPVARAAGAVAVAVVGIGATFDADTVVPPALRVPDASGELRAGQIPRGVTPSAEAAPASIGITVSTSSRARSAAPALSSASVAEQPALPAVAPATAAQPEHTPATTAPAGSPGQVDGAPRLELIRIPAIARRQIGEDDVHRAVLHLPDVTELVRDEVVARVAAPEQDRAQERVSVVAAQAGNPEEPRGVEDPDALDSDELGVEMEGVEPRLGAEDTLVRAPAPGG